ncbi:GNAT family N-acetyltransferase [Nonomuraea jiangxiensis]|uniref:Ribosomal protein S18 acetylase RimI n=1 Tax=Nonomuraea jiangxiensis TaxID=633440 RepID=A0A1G9PNP1_9ACTN|nr:GNAT family N-acetyltransferase [Nonomuraea jiangxiensis]SDM00223.1 Ribosomal protein S18 acetylase RimI [Nonomuraea jiangxiensis]
MDFSLRPAQPADFAAIAELTMDVYRDLLPSIPGAQEYLEKMRDVQGRAEQSELLAAVDNVTGQVLGAVSFVLPGTPYANLAVPGEGEFRLLAVASAAQGRGVGEALVRACLDRALSLGLHRVVLHTQSNMLAAQRLYGRLGFVRVPERDRAVTPDFALWAYSVDLKEAVAAD